MLPADAATSPSAEPPKPVYMVIAGNTLDRTRMAEYSRALADSGLYPKLAGYYVNEARPLAVFEGTPSADFVTLIVRFPSLDHARRFWQSPLYQERIRPLRIDPDAGDYTVTVYAEASLPAYMRGRVGSNAYEQSELNAK
jgi:uncharacterized protein (DUF1330 family)